MRVRAHARLIKVKYDSFTLKIKNKIHTFALYGLVAQRGQILLSKILITLLYYDELLTDTSINETTFQNVQC